MKPGALPFLSLLLLAACARREAFETNLPDDVAHAAILIVDAEGVLQHSTPIVDWSAGQALPVFRRAEERTWVLGWTEAQLARSDGRRPTGAELRAADPAQCAPRLPEPRWLGEVSAEGTALSLDVARAPKLTSSEISVCPNDPNLGALISCLAGCDPQIRALGDCAYELDFGACELGIASALVLPDGSSCVTDRASDDWHCSAMLESGPYGVADCQTPKGRCGLTVGVVPEEPPFQLDVFSFADVEPFLPHKVRQEGEVDPRTLRAGYAYDMLVYEEELLVSATGTVALENCFEVTAPPGRLLRMSLDTGRVTSSTPVPPCLSDIRTDPETPGFLGVYIRDEGFELARFARDGTIVAAQPIRASDGGLLDSSHNIMVHMDTLGPQIFVVLGSVGGVDRIHVFDQFTLAPIYDGPLPPIAATSAIRLSSREMLIGGSNPPGLNWYDTGRNTVERHIDLPFTDDLSVVRSVYAVQTFDERIVLHTSPPDLMVVTDQAGALLPQVPVPVGIPMLTALWPVDNQERSRLLFTARPSQASPGAFETAVTRFDAAKLQLQPGTWPIGHGVTNVVAADDKKRLYVLLPWAAQVVRLTPSAMP